MLTQPRYCVGTKLSYYNFVVVSMLTNRDTVILISAFVFAAYTCIVLSHYANTPVQYTAIFHGCKNVHFQMKFVNIFLIFAQNIDCGYTLEPPQ